MEIIPHSEVAQTTIQRFYSGENILITGGTGFLGKILIEKLLRTCKDINTIYLLIRVKKGKNMHTRIDELFEDTVFENLRQHHPKFRHQIQGISGDCSLPGLGLSAHDRQLLMSQVTVVFHAAATVRFDEKIRLAVAINVKGSRDMVDLCTGMKKLKSVVHVSTAYSHCPNTHIEEKFYCTPTEAHKLISITDSADDKLLECITPAIIGKWPNTYTYTKAVAEDLIRKEGTDLPIGVFRPSIVISSYKEPISGWVDNMYGPTGICAGAGTGVLRTLRCKGSNKANVVPVDMCVNSLITAAWKISKHHQKLADEKILKTDKDIPVYNYVSSAENAITWQQFMELCSSKGLCYPSGRAIWYYSLTLNRFWLVHWLYVILLQLLPALVMDAGLLCMGKQPQLVKVSRKIMKFSKLIEFFTLREWNFKNENVVDLWNSLDREDQKLFAFNMKEVDWHVYFQYYMRGIRVFLLKEPMITLPESLKRWRKLYWCHQFSKAIVALLVLKICWSILLSVPIILS